MALIDIYNLLYEDSTLKARVIAAAFVAAADIEMEDPGTADHAARLALANSIIENPRLGEMAFLKHVARNPTVQAAKDQAPDGDLEFIVASTWDAASRAAATKKEAEVAAIAAAAALKP